LAGEEGDKEEKEKEILAHRKRARPSRKEGQKEKEKRDREKKEKKKKGDRETMQNIDGDEVDLYLPRKCSYTNRLIHAADYASVQINIGHVDAAGTYTGEFTPVALCGFVRTKGASDEAINFLASKHGFLKTVLTHNPQ
jgi:small subunit ribosomal protein S21e